MKIAIISLLADAGHMIDLLHKGKLLQDNGFYIKFFGPSGNDCFCQQNNIPYSTFEIERPSNHEKILAKLSRINPYWQEAIYTKWYYVNYYEKTIYNGLKKELQLTRLAEDFKPCAILCDNFYFKATYELIASKVDCPIIFNFCPGSYADFQNNNHISKLPVNFVSKAVLAMLKKTLGKGLMEFNRLFNKRKFTSDEHVTGCLREYWSGYQSANLRKLRKLTISSGTGILEKKYLSDQINIPEHVFQVGPIPCLPQNHIKDDLLNWLNQDLKPVVYVALGSMIKGKIPFFSDIIKAATEEGFRILWSYHVKPWNDSLDSDHLWWEKWVPQTDIIAHKNVKLFISHCGSGSIREALWFSKLVVGIPFLWDQYYNSWILEQLCGIPTLNKNAINVRSIRSCIKTAQANRERYEKICAEYRSNEGSGILVDKIVKFIADR